MLVSSYKQTKSNTKQFNTLITLGLSIVVQKHNKKLSRYLIISKRSTEIDRYIEMV